MRHSFLALQSTSAKRRGECDYIFKDSLNSEILTSQKSPCFQALVTQHCCLSESTSVGSLGMYLPWKWLSRSWRPVLVVTYKDQFLQWLIVVNSWVQISAPELLSCLTLCSCLYFSVLHSVLSPSDGDNRIYIVRLWRKKWDNAWRESSTESIQ